MSDIITEIYKDGLQPAVRAGGEALAIMAKAALINSRIEPLRQYVLGYEHLQNLHQDLAQKLKDSPDNRIQTPDPHIAVPVLQAITYTGHHTELREMYANLLATAMDSKSASTVHPAFVEIIRQITPDEARIIAVLKQNEDIAMVDIISSNRANSSFNYIERNITLLPKIAKLTCSEAAPSYIDNLIRLGLLKGDDAVLDDKEAYFQLDRYAATVKDRYDAEYKAQNQILTKRRVAYFTVFGKQFCQACVEA